MGDRDVDELIEGVVAGDRRALVLIFTDLLDGAAAAPLLDAPPTPSAPGAPGPFGFADDARVCGILAEAGLRDAKAEALDLPMLLAGGGVEEALEVSLQVGPCGQIVRENPHLADKVRDVVRAALAAHLTDAGVSLPAAAWVYTALV